MPIELRRWFQAFIGALSLLITGSCLLLVRSALPAGADAASIGVSILFIAAIPGWIQIFRMFLPLLLVKLWPSLDVAER